MRVWRMRNGISITLKPGDCRRLKALTRDRNAPQKHVWRAEIVLLSADGIGTNEIMRETGKSKTCVWRWQERFMQEGYDGLSLPDIKSGRIDDVILRAAAWQRSCQRRGSTAKPAHPCPAISEYGLLCNSSDTIKAGAGDAARQTPPHSPSSPAGS